MSRAELNESATIMADEFGSVGTYTPVVGTPVTVAPVMTYGFQLIDDFGAYELRDRANIDMAEYPGEPEQGDSLVVGDDSYTVDTWEQVGSMWHITLRIGVAPAPPVDTTPPYITTIQVNGGLGIATSRTISVDVLIAADDISSVLDMSYLVNTVPGTPPAASDPGWLSYANRLTPVTVPADGNYTFTGYAKDEAGNVSIGQEFAQQQVFIDSIAPEVVSGQVDVTGLVLTIGMSEAVTGNIGFSMTADGLDVALSNPTAPDASTIQFDVAQIGPGQVLLLSYAAGDVIDQVGNPLADFTGQSVTNNSEADLIAPEVVSAQVDVTGLVLTLGMSEPVTGNLGFSMTSDGLVVALSNPTAPDASTIQFDVEQVFQGQVLLLSYTAGDVADQASNPLADFSGQSVTNNSDVSGVPVPVLSAFTYDPDTFEVQDKAIGVGSVATSRVAVINVPDDQLVYKQVASGDIAYHGARYVGDVAYADDGAGTLLDPQPYAAVAPVSTNKYLNSDNFEPAAFTRSTLTRNTQIAVDGRNNGHTMTEDTTAAAAHYVHSLLGAGIPNVAGTYYTFAVWAKPNGRDFIRVTLFRSSQVLTVYFDLLNAQVGTISAAPSQGDYSASASLEGNGWVRCAITFMTNVVDGVVNADLWLSPADGVGSYDGDGVSGAHLCYPQFIENADSADLLYPIFTSGAEVTRDKDAITLNSGNLSDAAGTIVFDAVQQAGGDNGVISQFLSRVSGVYRMTDGTAQIDSAVVNGSLQVGMVWGNGVMDLAIGGVWVGEQAYDGTLPDGILDLFRASAYAQRIMNLKIYDVSDKGLIA